MAPVVWGDYGRRGALELAELVVVVGWLALDTGWVKAATVFSLEGSPVMAIKFDATAETTTETMSVSAARSWRHHRPRFLADWIRENIKALGPRAERDDTRGGPTNMKDERDDL